MKKYGKQHQQQIMALLCCIFLLLQTMASAQAGCAMMLETEVSKTVSQHETTSHGDMDHSKMDHASMNHDLSDSQNKIVTGHQDCCNDCSCDMNTCQTQSWLDVSKYASPTDLSSADFSLLLAWQLNKFTNKLLRPPSIT